MHALIILVSCGAAALPPPERCYLHLVLVSPGTPLLLRAASEWRTMFSFKTRHVLTYLSYCPLLPFFWPSMRRKLYFHQAKAMRNETDGGINSSTRYRRSCSDAKKSAYQIRFVNVSRSEKRRSSRNTRQTTTIVDESDGVHGLVPAAASLCLVLGVQARKLSL